MSCVMIKTQSILSRWRVYVFHLMQFCPCSSFLLEMKCSSPIMFARGKTLDHNYDSNIQLNQLIILYSLFMEGKEISRAWNAQVSGKTVYDTKDSCASPIVLCRCWDQCAINQPPKRQFAHHVLQIVSTNSLLFFYGYTHHLFSF